MAQSRNGMMSSVPSLVQALRPGFINTAMDPGLAEYQTPASGNVKIPYDPLAAAKLEAAYQTPAEGMNKMAYNPDAAAKFQAAMQANRAQRPQMGQQQFSGMLQQVGQPLPQGASMPQYVRNQGMKNPPFYNPPPGQNMNMQMQGGMGQNMVDNNAFQGNFQEFLAGRGQGGVPPEAFQNYFQQQSQQSQPQAQRTGANAGRVRQSPGVYKDPNTGALYGNDGKLMRAGTRRMR